MGIVATTLALLKRVSSVLRDPFSALVRAARILLVVRRVDPRLIGVVAVGFSRQGDQFPTRVFYAASNSSIAPRSSHKSAVVLSTRAYQALSRLGVTRWFIGPYSDTAQGPQRPNTVALLHIRRRRVCEGEIRSVAGRAGHTTQGISNPAWASVPGSIGSVVRRPATEVGHHMSLSSNLLLVPSHPSPVRSGSVPGPVRAAKTQASGTPPPRQEA